MSYMKRDSERRPEWSKPIFKDIGQHVGQTVELRGWLYNKRSSGKIQFLLVRDGTGVIKGYAEKRS